MASRAMPLTTPEVAVNEGTCENTQHAVWHTEGAQEMLVIFFKKYQNGFTLFPSQISFPWVLILHPSWEPHRTLLPPFLFQSSGCEDTS